MLSALGSVAGHFPLCLLDTPLPLTEKETEDLQGSNLLINAGVAAEMGERVQNRRMENSLVGLCLPYSFVSRWFQRLLLTLGGEERTSLQPDRV